MQARFGAGDATRVVGGRVCPEQQEMLRTDAALRLCDAHVHRVTGQACKAIAGIQGEISEAHLTGHVIRRGDL